MDPYLLTLGALVAALIAQALAAGLCAEMVARPVQPAGERGIWLALAVAALLAALHHGYTLELAVRTGLFDLRQATLAALSAVLVATAVWGFRRRSP
jgi:membrane protease YdiL (CAAX protease family)